MVAERTRSEAFAVLGTVCSGCGSDVHPAQVLGALTCSVYRSHRARLGSQSPLPSPEHQLGCLELPVSPAVGDAAHGELTSEPHPAGTGKCLRR